MSSQERPLPGSRALRYRRLFRNISLAIMLIGAYVVVAKLGDRGSPGGSEGGSELERAPSFELPVVIHGEEAFAQGREALTRADLQGQPVLINFWASWCTACEAEKPRLKALAAREGEEALTLVGIASRDTRPAVAASGAQRFGYPILLDQDGSVARKFGVRGLPQTLLLGPDSQVLYRVRGTLDQDHIARIDEILGRPSSASSDARATQNPGG